MAPIPDTVLAGLPRVVRVADEARWRGQSAVATAIVVAVFWVSTWLLGEPVQVARTLVGATAVFVPTFAIVWFAARRRVRDSLLHTAPPPRSCVHETAAASRERRMRLVSVVLLGLIALMVFDRLSGGGGTMAGLVVGLLAAVGACDWRESRMWRDAERERDSRLFAVVRPRALTPRIPPGEIFESSATGAGGPIEMPADPLDL